MNKGDICEWGGGDICEWGGVTFVNKGDICEQK